MKEQDLVDLGFERTDVSAEESGDEAFYYYTYEFTKDFSMISSDNGEAEKEGWFVEIFDYSNIRFFQKKDLKVLIDLINKNKV
jgi:ADP-dependent phosphofructokinase/glucokinase